MSERPQAPLALQDRGDRTVEMSGAIGAERTGSRLLALLFLAAIFVVPTTQVVYELVTSAPLVVAELWDIAKGSFENWRKPATEREEDYLEKHLRAFETDLRESSLVHQVALPWYQAALTATLGKGNQKAIEGRDGWLFYREDLLNTAGPGVMDDGVGGQEAVAAIVDFRDQLRAFGVELLVVPSVSKEMVDAREFTRFADGATLHNRGLEAFYAALAAQGIDLLRMDEALDEYRRELGEPRPLTLPRDTHWRPETMQWFAGTLARRIEAKISVPPHDGPALYRTEAAIARGAGDLTRMLRLPEAWPVLPEMEIETQKVVRAVDGARFQSDPTAEILLMGDSLTLVFGDPSLGLGESAGLAEHLALELDRPLDVIAQAGGSATATREALARREQSVGGKTLVVWQFGVRMLAMGPERWKKVEIPPPAAQSAPVTPAKSHRVTARITEISRIPDGFDYEFCLLVYQYEVTGSDDPALPVGKTVWVAHVAKQVGEDLPGSRYEEDEVHELLLEPVEDHYDLERVSWIDDTDADFEIWFAVESKDV